MKSLGIIFSVFVTIGSPVAAQDSILLNQDNTRQDQQLVLIINSFDAKSIKARNNKKELFRELTDSLVVYLAKKVQHLPGYEPLVIPTTLSKMADLDSTVLGLIKEKKAAKAIVIWSVEARFQEAGEKKDTDPDDGKPVTITSYDLCAKNEYILYNTEKVVKHSTIENCEFFTTRSVKGGFTIHFGPDIVGKRKHSYQKVENNATAYITEISWLLAQ